MRTAALALALLVGCSATPDRKPVVQSFGVLHEAELTGFSDAEAQDYFFSGQDLLEIDLYLALSAMDELSDNPEGWVRADFTVDGLTFHDVGVRVKGNGSFRTIYEKPSLKIEFDRFVPGQDFFGLDVLVLNNMISDPSKLKERTAYTLYRAAGVPAARAAHSTLRIRDEDYGLYTHMEDVDTRMLARWFDNPHGPLFELFDVVLQPTDVPLFEHEDGPDDRTVLQAAAEDLVLPTRDEQIAAVVEHIDLEAFLTFYAVSGYVGQFDAWPLNTPGDDVHLYVEPTTQQIHFIPHGLDESFRQFERNIAIPGASLLAQACYFTTDCNERLDARFWEIDDLANQIGLADQTAGWAEQTADAVWLDERDDHTVEEVLLWQGVISEFLLQRDEKLLENIGPR